MVTHSGTSVRADRLRPLNTPRPIRVEADDRGFPLNVDLGRRAGTPTIAVKEIVDRWRIDDEWWRQEISRMYFQVVLAGGAILDIFQDLLQGGWYLQATASPTEKAEPVEVLAPSASQLSTQVGRRTA